jgi:thiamine pyrophosphate-dependent acetolactate synthase large subunit-like protein
VSAAVTVHRRIAEVLHEQGVEAVFTLMSEDIAKLTVDIDGLGIPLYKTRHDSTAVGMADGYARTSGRVGVAMIGRGPALTNALNPLVTAAKARSGVILLIGEAPLDPVRAQAARAERMGKYIDQEGVLRSVGVESIVLNDSSTVSAEVASCFDRARQGEVIAIRLPIDLLDAVIRHEPAGLPPRADAATIAPKLEEIAVVADLLQESWAASRPVILAGAGAVAAEAHDELTQLGELTGALMATTLLASSYFRDDPFNIGFLGTMSTPLGSELAMQADIVLAFGASLNPYTTYRGDLLRNARVIQFDSSPNAAGRYLQPEMSVVGDAKLSARALVDELRRRGAGSTGFRRPETRARIAAFEPAIGSANRPDGLDPRAVLRRLNDLLPAERTLVVDGGHHFEFSIANVDVPDPSGFVFANEYFSVSCGLAAALGAAVARPERLTVLTIGDGGFMMNLGDLDTAVRYRLPMVVVALDDGGFGSEMHYLRANGLSDATARYNNPSLAQIAGGLGARAVTITEMTDIEKVSAELKDLDGPLVLDCKVASSVRADWVDFLFAPAPTAPEA